MAGRGAHHPRFASWLLAGTAVGVCGLLAAAGCGSGRTVSPAAGPPTTPGVLTLAADVQPIFTAHCAFPGCHAGSAPASGQDLSAGNAFGNIVGVDSLEVPSRKRVQPGDPDASYLFEKVSQERPAVGERMPLGASPLSSGEIATIRQWIAQGALP
jgi:hypothetical protein